MSCSIQPSHSVVSSRSRICTRGQRNAVAPSASKSSEKKSSSRLSGTRIVSPLSEAATSRHRLQLVAFRSQQFFEFGSAGAAIGACPQCGADLCHSCQLLIADRAANRGFPHRKAGANHFAPGGRPWFESCEQREPVFRLEQLAKQPRRLFSLGESGARRGEKHASFQSAAD